MSGLQAITTVATTATSAAGAYQQAQAQKQQGEYDQAQFNYRASVARLQAEQADERALEEEALASRQAGEQYRQFKLQQSRAIAIGAKSGSETTFGDILKTQEDFEELALNEATVTLHEGESRAKQYRKQSSAFRTDARNLTLQGNISKTTGKRKARSTLITGAGNLLKSLDSLIPEETKPTPAPKPKPKPKP